MSKKKDYFMYELKLNKEKSKIIKSDKYYKILFILFRKMPYQI